MEFNTELCNSFNKEAEIFSIKQTFFMGLLTLTGVSIVLSLILHSIGLKVGSYLLGAMIPTILLLYLYLRTAGERISIVHLFKLMTFKRTPKFIQGASYDLADDDRHDE